MVVSDTDKPELRRGVNPKRQTGADRQLRQDKSDCRPPTSPPKGLETLKTPSAQTPPGRGECKVSSKGQRSIIGQTACPGLAFC